MEFPPRTNDPVTYTVIERDEKGRWATTLAVDTPEQAMAIIRDCRHHGGVPTENMKIHSSLHNPVTLDEFLENLNSRM